MEFIIRDAKKSDVKSILKLIKELAIFEREPNEVILTEQQLIIDGFQDQPKFKCFIAEIEKEVVGLSLIHISEPTRLR